MTVYALNGLGRIGKLALKPLLERGAQIAWINDAVGDPAMHAHLLEFDTVHGRWNTDFGHDDQSVTIDGTRLPFVGTSDLSKLPLDGVDVVIYKLEGHASDRYFRRNERMLSEAPKGVLVFSEKSAFTRHAVETARKMGLPVKRCGLAS